MTSKSQLNLPPTELRTSERDSAVFRNSEDGPERFRKAEHDGYIISAALIDDTMTRARLTNQEVAYVVGVSESLVQKWRSADARACPSFAQLLRLPPTFHLELLKTMNGRFGFGRALLRAALDALADVALVMER